MLCKGGKGSSFEEISYSEKESRLCKRVKDPKRKRKAREDVCCWNVYKKRKTRDTRLEYKRVEYMIACMSYNDTCRSTNVCAFPAHITHRIWKSGEYHVWDISSFQGRSKLALKHDKVMSNTIHHFQC